MDVEIKNENIIYVITEKIDEIFASFFYDDLLLHLNAKHYNYIIKIDKYCKIETIKFILILIYLANFCLKFQKNVTLLTNNEDFIELLKLIKCENEFKILDYNTNIPVE